MRKRFLFLVVLASVCAICSAQTVKYRYAIINDRYVLIGDYAEKIPEDRLNSGYPTILPLNTKEERFRAETAFRKIESYFYNGTPFIYLDGTIDSDNPDLNYINSWYEVLEYIRGTK